MSEERKKTILDVDVNAIGNKMKRIEVYHRKKAARNEIKSIARKKRARERDVLGELAPPPKAPRTVENTREEDETVVDPEDEEVQGEEEMDEFAKYFKGGYIPKLCITTSIKPNKIAYEFIKEILFVFPNSYFYPRRRFGVPQLVKECVENGFSDLLIFNENHDQIDGLTIVHLPEGPTTYFKLSNVKMNREIEGSAKIGQTTPPEIILNRFTTRVGQRVARVLAALFHQEPNFRGRRVMTFHNQRDFIFFRHHRYVFQKFGVASASGEDAIDHYAKERITAMKNKKLKKGTQAHRDAQRDKSDKLYEAETIINDNKVRALLQEVGPQFTMKLKWIQHGIWDRDAGEYEWRHNNDLGKRKKKFFL